MGTICKLAKTELQTLFYSLVAWLIIIIFTIQTAMVFTSALGMQLATQELGRPLWTITSGIFASPWGGVFPALQEYLYLYIPLLTMGLMSRELGSGSIKLLYSSPITNVQIILGKFLSMMIYGLVLVGIVFLFALFGAFTIKDFDFPVVLSGMLGFYLLICTYAAVGLFMSSLTPYQVVAAILTLTMLGVLNYVKTLWQDLDFVREITYWLSISGRANEFMLGLICSEDVLYFVIVTALFLSLAVIRLQACRQKMPWTRSLVKYLGVLCLACLLGYVSSRPRLMGYYDTSATKLNTLTPNSQEVISKLDGGLTITTYVNVLDERDLWTAMPSQIKRDQDRFRQYTRFKPEIKMKYVYYYDTLLNTGMSRNVVGRSTEESAKELMRVFDLDTSLFLSPEEIRSQIDLFPEKNRFVRLLERENGEKTFLRVFDDMQHHPGEAEITAAFKRIAMELPVVGFLSCNGARNINKIGDRDYSMFAYDKSFRYYLINQGFDVREIDLSSSISDDIDILVVSDLTTSLSDVQESMLDDYIQRGGDLMILTEPLTEPTRENEMSSLLSKFNVKMIPGMLVSGWEDYSPEVVISSPTKEGENMVYWFENMQKSGQVIVTPGVAGLYYDNHGDFTMIPLFETDTSVWNEIETVNFVEETPLVNMDEGESHGKFITGLALSRKVGDENQKIVILGDADCISNGVLSRNYKGIFANNYSIVMGSFYWMSDGEVPIDVRRPAPLDDRIYLSQAGQSIWKIIMIWVLPGIMVLFALLLWFRRRGR